MTDSQGQVGERQLSAHPESFPERWKHTDNKGMRGEGGRMKERRKK